MENYHVKKVIDMKKTALKYIQIKKEQKDHRDITF